MVVRLCRFPMGKKGPAEAASTPASWPEGRGLVHQDPADPSPQNSLSIKTPPSSSSSSSCGTHTHTPSQQQLNNTKHPPQVHGQSPPLTKQNKSGEPSLSPLITRAPTPHSTPRSRGPHLLTPPMGASTADAKTKTFKVPFYFNDNPPRPGCMPGLGPAPPRPPSLSPLLSYLVTRGRMPLQLPRREGRGCPPSPAPPCHTAAHQTVG